MGFTDWVKETFDEHPVLTTVVGSGVCAVGAVGVLFAAPAIVATAGTAGLLGVTTGTVISTVGATVGTGAVIGATKTTLANGAVDPVTVIKLSKTLVQVNMHLDDLSQKNVNKDEKTI